MTHCLQKARIRQMLTNISAHSLKLVGERIMLAQTEGATITHATDSTTRKIVGTFAPAGLHIDRKEYLPFPTLNITSETIKNTLFIKQLLLISNYWKLLQGIQLRNSTRQ